MKLLLRTLKVLLLGLFLVVALGPLYWVIVTSLKGGQEIYTFPIRYWPSEVTFENYKYLFR
ncbi:MAG TPA: sugar ABC transporter permease, partial [Firmicutes bacterium]|nr:sugar ABC transporter permease [Bacillota bacterium]